jgi:hypothetical protein
MAKVTIPQPHPNILLLLRDLSKDFAKADALFVTIAEHITNAEKTFGALRELLLESAQTCFEAHVDCEKLAQNFGSLEQKDD